eukprot:CAMPEP_0204614074 /NCGR_PEP_ID=MMETSP0717-20131115/1892_1 /ASSEMBLY_ACC=CAM_ASM_000666 /TAXON_ID=230516 /ORGANISM="Chaetoceros curvisetus" /LENGTH=642 /DNA_ID=CAMNT_0051626665 /DNA_START=45 /DNA_END=1974 /DNA_ORIENTATION=+
MVFKPSDDVNEIKKSIEPTQDPITKFELYGETKETHNSEHHFDTKHYALLFEPGEYKDCDFEVGYYVQMAGLGKDAKGKNAVRFTGAKSGPYVEALNKDMPVTEGGSIAQPGSGLCLDTFWRSAENYSAENTQWAVSQAAPLRRVHIDKELMIGDGAAYSSGGFVANAEVEGLTHFTANQQWFSRAIDFHGEVKGGSWSTVFAGCTGENLPTGDVLVGEHVATIEDKPEARMEKPFIVLNNERTYYELHVPKATTTETSGANLDSDTHEVRSFSQVKVGKPILPTDTNGNYKNHDDDTYNIISPEDGELTMELQTALDEGKDLLLCPGIFFLTKPLVVKHPNQVILGLGLATLVAPQDGSPCIRVNAKTPGVRIAGLMLEASVQTELPSPSPNANSDGVTSLIEFGEPDVTNDTGDATNPGLLSDIFTRVGGSNLDRSVSTDVMVRVHSGNVVGDNLWLWRADHVRLDKANGEKPNDPNFPYYHQVRIGECTTKNAIEVRGDNVKMYGLFCEHTTEHQMVWKGEGGSVTFFQCELPYDVNIDFGHNGFTGYYVDGKVDVHTARGIGVYTNFQVFNVHANAGIILPSKDSIVLQNPFTRFLNNLGGIRNVVLQGKALAGDAVTEKSRIARSWVGEKRAIVKLV